MDNLTHALSGVLIARATAPDPVEGRTIPLGRRVLLGAIAATVPDLDFVLTWISPLTYLTNHRGVTHSLLLLPAWSLVYAWLCALVWRRGPGWRAYFSVFAWGIGIHIVGDWITSFGTLVLAPWSDARYGLSATFIIDLWLTAVLLAGTLACLAWRRSRLPAIATLLVAAGYIAFQDMQRREAIALGQAHARRQGLAGATVTALPRPASPYNWTVLVEAAERIDYAHVRLVDTPPLLARLGVGFIDRLAAAYVPESRATWKRVARFGEPDAAPLARAALESPALGFFRWFAAYPALLRVDRDGDATCAWFQDLRFETPGRDVMPFRYGACRAGNGAWEPFELDGAGARVPVR